MLCKIMISDSGPTHVPNSKIDFRHFFASLVFLQKLLRDAAHFVLLHIGKNAPHVFPGGENDLRSFIFRYVFQDVHLFMQNVKYHRIFHFSSGYRTKDVHYPDIYYVLRLEKRFFDFFLKKVRKSSYYSKKPSYMRVR